MRRLLACTCLTPLAVAAVGSVVHAETVIGTKTTAPVATATANNGAPDNIRISPAGSIVPSAGVAVTVNSNNSIANEGTIQLTGANNATGIRGNPGAGGNITNSGKIILDEDYAPTDVDKDGDLDGPLAQGNNRIGIHVAPGGTFLGAINNAGAITIEGNQSAGIAADGRLAGSLTSTGTIGVTGNNSVGIRAQEVAGNVRLEGTIAAQGASAVGVDLAGDIGGSLTLQGSITATGYRLTAAPSDPSKLDADDLLQGGPALRIAGNVAGGIQFAAPPPNNNPDDKDEDDDGIDDANEGVAKVTSYGVAPAVQIGATDRTVTIGAVAGNASGHGLVVNGEVSAVGVYNGVNAQAFQIGGFGGNVTIAGGMTVGGAVGANSNTANAIGIRIGAGATVDEINVTGKISASSGNSATSISRGILIDANANVGTIRNSGTINASVGGEGASAAIIDNSGRVTLVENRGTIQAAGAANAADRTIALDLRANGTGATVRQLQTAQNAAAPKINGTILFGAGDDVLDAADGAISGAARFGNGDNRLALTGDAAFTGSAQFGAGSDRLTMAGSSTFAGTADFGGGSDRLELSGTSRFTGSLVNAGGLTVQVDGGELEVANTGTVALASLSVAAKGGLGVNIGDDGHTTYQVAGTASLAQGTEIYVDVANVRDAPGTYTFLRAGSLVGGTGLELEDGALPFMFEGSLVTNAAANEVSLVVARRSADELGLNRSGARAFDAIFAALDEDEDVADAFLAITDAETFGAAVAQLLPEHAGGAFDAVTQGSRATARFLADPRAPLADHGRWGYWLQQVTWGSSKDVGDTSSYDIMGWGAAGGAELITGNVGNFGLSFAYLNGEDEHGEADNSVRASQFELAGYWRFTAGGLHAHARASAGTIDFDGARHFNATVGGTEVTRTTTGSWNGQLLSAAAGVTYELRTGRLSLRPAASVDYYRLHEDGYTEAGGGAAFDLTVDERTSDELAATASVTAGFDFGSTAPASGWFRAEVEGGRREIIAGALGDTTARFGDGNPFTLVAEDRGDGWIGRLRLAGGTPGFTLAGEASAEEQFGEAALAFRVSLQIGL